MTVDHSPARAPVVLVADDQELVVRSLETVLTPRGLSVMPAYSGTQALMLAFSAQPDAIILDYQMPDLTAAEICRELRSDPRFPRNVPIIVTVAGSYSRIHRLNAYQAGAWDVCTEPFDIEVLLIKLDRYLEARLSAPAARY